MSFPALAVAAAAATEISRYTGVKHPFLDSLDISVSHVSHTDGRPVLQIKATAELFGYLRTTADGRTVGLHDHSTRP